MQSRDTGTGDVLEQMVTPALQRGTYAFRKRVRVGKRLGCGAHIVDLVAERDGRKILVSLKWQQTRGTAEQKIPFEVICLGEAVATGGFQKAYLVLGGEGWTLRDFYTRGGLETYLRNVSDVSIVTLESFIADANQGRL